MDDVKPEDVVDIPVKVNACRRRTRIPWIVFVGCLGICSLAVPYILAPVISGIIVLFAPIAILGLIYAVGASFWLTSSFVLGSIRRTFRRKMKKED